MRNQIILLSILASLSVSGCKALECAEGTVERDGRCEVPTGAWEDAKCGPFTELIGDQCLPQFPPTVCGDGVDSETDPDTGVTTCTGGGPTPCGVPITCPTPTGASKQNFCGQIYDFETSAPLGDVAGTPGVECDPAAPTASGPCALKMLAYDALVFAADPMAATELPKGKVYLDNCGRFRVVDVETNGTGPFIGLGIDDAASAMMGPSGTTVTVAIATPKQGMTASRGLEHFIVKPSTIAAWAGNPPLTGGIYAPVFRKHKVGNGPLDVPQDGVTVTKNGNTIPSNDFYFSNTDPDTRNMVSTTLTATGPNGTALITGAIASEGLVYNGQGGLGAGCRWDPHAGASLPGIVFIQIFRKLDVLGMTCND